MCVYVSACEYECLWRGIVGLPVKIERVAIGTGIDACVCYLFFLNVCTYRAAIVQGTGACVCYLLSVCLHLCILGGKRARATWAYVCVYVQTSPSILHSQMFAFIVYFFFICITDLFIIYYIMITHRHMSSPLLCAR